MILDSIIDASNVTIVREQLQLNNTKEIIVNGHVLPLKYNYSNDLEGNYDDKYIIFAANGPLTGTVESNPVVDWSINGNKLQGKRVSYFSFARTAGNYVVVANTRHVTFVLLPVNTSHIKSNFTVPFKGAHSTTMIHTCDNYIMIVDPGITILTSDGVVFYEAATSIHDTNNLYAISNNWFITCKYNAVLFSIPTNPTNVVLKFNIYHDASWIRVSGEQLYINCKSKLYIYSLPDKI